MNKRVEIDIEPVHPSHMQRMIDIRNTACTSVVDKALASAYLELAARFNELLLKLHHGMVSISEEPPEPRQFARKPRE